MNSRVTKIKETYQRAQRELLADYQRHEQNWKSLLGAVETAQELQKGTMYYGIDGSSALIAEVHGRPYIFPWQEYHEAARAGLLTSFRRKQKLRGFVWDDGDLEICMHLTFREVKRLAESGVALTAGYQMPIKGTLGLPLDNPNSWQKAIFCIAASMADSYADVELKDRDRWRGAEEYDPSKHVTDHAILCFERPPLAVQPITVTPVQWDAYMAHPPAPQIATEGRDLRRYPSERAAPNTRADEFVPASAVEEETRTEINQWMYHKELGKVKLFRFLSDTNALVEHGKDKKALEVLNVDLSPQAWPKTTKVAAEKIIPFKAPTKPPC